MLIIKVSGAPQQQSPLTPQPHFAICAAPGAGNGVGPPTVWATTASALGASGLPTTPTISQGWATAPPPQVDF